MAKKNKINVDMQFGILSNGENDEYERIFQYYKLLALNRYRWKNLPNGIESRHIEEFLFNYGQVFFTKDEELGYICLSCYTAGQLNVYGDPLRVNMVGVGFSKMKDIDDGVRVLSNDVALPDILQISHFARKIADVETTTDENIEQQRTPYIIATDKNNIFSMKKIFEKVKNKKEKAIYVDKQFVEDRNVGISILRTDADYKADKLLDYKASLENELLMYLGINTAHTKEERMLVDEINVNNSQIEMNLDLGFKARKLGVELINKKYGLNIEVEKVANIIETTFDTTLCQRKHLYDDNNNNGIDDINEINHTEGED